MNASVKIIVGVVAAAIISGILLAFFMGPFKGTLASVQPDSYKPEDNIYKDMQAVEELQNRPRPVIKARNGAVLVGQAVDVMDYLDSITDADGADLTGQVKIKGDSLWGDSATFHSLTPGVYHITYSVTDSHGLTAKKSIAILVNNEKGGTA